MIYTVTVSIALAAGVALLVALLAYPHLPRRLRARPDTPVEMFANRLRELEPATRQAAHVIGTEFALKVQTIAADIRSRNDRRH